MANVAPIQLRQGLEIQLGEPVFDNNNNQYNHYFIVDNVKSHTLTSLSEEKALALLGKNTLSEDDKKKLTTSLSNRKMLKGQIPPTIPTGTTEQKMLYQSIPLPFKPDQFLQETQFIGKLLFHPITALIFIFLLLCVILITAGQQHYLLTYTSTAFSAAWLMEHALTFTVAFVLIRVMHEFSHAYACKIAGGFVEGFMITFIAGAPLPSTKMNWLHKANIKQRLIISLAGIYIELWLAVIACYLWLITPVGEYKALWHYIAIINPMLTLSVNLLPMKFDGYHVLAAITRNPQLYEMAISHFRGLCHRILGLRPRLINTGLTYQTLLPIYGFIIFIWKMFVLPLSIMASLWYIFNNDRIAYLFILAAIVVFFIKPAKKELTHLKSIVKVNMKMPVINLMIALTLLLAWLIIPLPHVDTVQGGVIYENQLVTAPNKSIGVNVREDGYVKEGDQIVQLENIELSFNHSRLVAQYDQVNSDITKTNYEQFAQSKTIEKQVDVLSSRSNLNTIRAEYPGYWQRQFHKTSYNQGDVIGRIVQPNKGKLNVYIPKSITTDQSIKVSYVTTNGLINRCELTKVSDVSVTASIPKYLFNDVGSVFDSSSTIQPIQRYQSEYLSLPEGQVTVYIKTWYSVAVILFNRLSEQLFKI